MAAIRKIPQKEEDMGRRFPLLLSFGLSIGLAATAHAGGYNLNWGPGCYPEGPQNLRTFACDTNSGSASFVVSFIPGYSLPFVGLSAWVDISSISARLPNWWQLQGTGCRGTSLSVSTDFITAPQKWCVDPWEGEGTGSWIYHTRATAPLAANEASLFATFSRPTGYPVNESQEYYGIKGTINFAKTVGAGACAGCPTSASLVVSNLVVSYEGGISDVYSFPIGDWCIFWQSPGVPCALPTPAARTTWGQIKSLYR